MSDLQLRDARPEDATAMLDVIEAAYRGEGGWTTESHLVSGARTTLDEVAEYIADPRRLMIVAERPLDEAPVEEEPRIVGCCSVLLPAQDQQSAAAGTSAVPPPEFGLFAVDPRVQGGGIGQGLLSAAEERLIALGVHELMIEVLQSRPELRAWYERRGFVPTGEVLAFPGQGLKVAGLGMDVLVKRLG